MSAFNGLLPWFGLHGWPALPRKRKPGRPRKRTPNLLGAPPPRGVGRPAQHDLKRLRTLVDHYMAAEAARGRRIRRNTALLELWVKELEQSAPQKHARIQNLLESCSLRRALQRAFDIQTVRMVESRLKYAVHGRKKARTAQELSRPGRKKPSK